jgi:hypothetical protein
MDAHSPLLGQSPTTVLFSKGAGRSVTLSRQCNRNTSGKEGQWVGMQSTADFCEVNFLKFGDVLLHPARRGWGCGHQPQVPEGDWLCLSLHSLPLAWGNEAYFLEPAAWFPVSFVHRTETLTRLHHTSLGARCYALTAQIIISCSMVSSYAPFQGLEDERNSGELRKGPEVM